MKNNMVRTSNINDNKFIKYCERVTIVLMGICMLLIPVALIAIIATG